MPRGQYDHSCRIGEKRPAQRRAMRKLWRNPSTREMYLSRIQEGVKSPRKRRLAAIQMRNRWKGAAYREKMIKVIQGVVRSQTSKVQISIFRSLCSRGIRGQRLNFRFGTYFADIAFPKRKLVIELDGWLHKERRSADRKRDRFFRKHGWLVRRLPASWRSLPAVLEVLHVTR